MLQRSKHPFSNTRCGGVVRNQSPAHNTARAEQRHASAMLDTNAMLCDARHQTTLAQHSRARPPVRPSSRLTETVFRDSTTMLPMLRATPLGPRDGAGGSGAFGVEMLGNEKGKVSDVAACHSYVPGEGCSEQPNPAPRCTLA